MSEPMPHPPDPDRVAGAYARNGDVELWYQHFVGGDGATPLLLINGLGSPSVAYQKGFVDELLAVGFDVVRFDNRDLGRSSRITASSPTEPGYRLADMARDAVAVLDAVGWDRAVVFGQSMGGMIAQQLAIDHPERLLALVSLMSSTGNRSVGHPSASAKAGLLSVPPNDRAGWLDHRVETERYWASPALGPGVGAGEGRGDVRSRDRSQGHGPAVPSGACEPDARRRTRRGEGTYARPARLGRHPDRPVGRSAHRSVRRRSSVRRDRRHGPRSPARAVVAPCG
ncbi:MAG: alpha/beta fold hydrolase [Acidimicrobiales bacterium]